MKRANLVGLASSISGYSMLFHDISIGHSNPQSLPPPGRKLAFALVGPDDPELERTPRRFAPPDSPGGEDWRPKEKKPCGAVGFGRRWGVSLRSHDVYLVPIGS